MALIDELYEGSFRGARFLIRSASTDFGRKQIKHEYPNSDRQSIQDLGLRPRVFRMTAVISTETTVDPRTYFQKKNQLLEALELPGPGTLSHPWFFSSFQVVARPGTVEERIDELGIATFNLTFDISDRQTDPIVAPTSLAQINQGVQNTNAAINTNIANNFQTSTNLNFTAAQELLSSFTELTESSTNTFNKLETPGNEFAALLGDFNSNINDLIAAPQDLADSFQNVIQTSAALYQTTSEALQVFSRFFNFGDDTNVFPDTTAARIERNLNNKTIHDATQISYLSLSYQFAAQSTFTTVDEITELQTNLDNQYQKLVENDASNDILLPLNDLRVLTNEFLEAEKLNASQLFSVNTHTIPLQVLAFNYYGDVDDLQTITNTLVDLNRPLSNNSAFIEGDINILTQ